MSGLEILGVAASILQIADLGATVSVKLCTFYRQLKSADQSAQSLSSEVALTCSILRQLGENLKQDEQTRLYSVQAFETAQEVLRECEKVFKRISAAVDESRADATKNAIQRAARRFGFVLMERELDMLKGNLERLKSTMLLLLNVIMYAGQLRSRAEWSVRQEQKDLIKVLVEEKKASEERLEELRRFDQLVKDTGSVDINRSQGLAGQEALPPYEPLAQEDALRELQTYHQLVKRLLQEVDACRSGIERTRYSRFRNGVVKAHAAEVEGFRRAHGEIVTRLFEDPLFRLVPETGVVDPRYLERDKAEEAERQERKRRRDEESTRHRSFPSESYERDRLPLQPSGFNPYAGQIEHFAPPMEMANPYPPPGRAFGDYEGTIEGIPPRIGPNMASAHAPLEGQSNTRTTRRQINHIARQRQAPSRSEATALAGYEVYCDMPVPEEAKKAADAVVDDLLLKWTTIAK